MCGSRNKLVFVPDEIAYILKGDNYPKLNHKHSSFRFLISLYFPFLHLSRATILLVNLIKTFLSCIAKIYIMNKYEW